MVLESINIPAFSRLIRTLLLEHNRVSLPGIGSFIAENKPSMLLDDGRMIHAPTRVVTFSIKEIWNDEWLERAYAAELDRAMLELEDGDELTREQLEEKSRQTLQLFLDQAKREIKQFTTAVMGQLQTEGMFQFPGLGILRMGKKKQEITFEKAAECDLSPQEFGLEAIPIKPLASPSRMSEPKKPTVRVERAPERESSRERETTSKRITSGKSFKWIYICLGIILLIIVLFVLTYVFRDELRPLLLRILYSAGDRPYVDKVY